MSLGTWSSGTSIPAHSYGNREGHSSSTGVSLFYLTAGES
jgi:hypothetical protein